MADAVAANTNTGTAQAGTSVVDQAAAAATASGQRGPDGKFAPKTAATPDAAAKGAVAEAAAEAKRRLKIDDEEIDEDEVIKVYRDRKGHQRAANKEFQEGRAARKQAEEFISLMKDKGKLMEVIQKLGHDPRKLSEEYLAAQLQDEMMDPRDKELRDTKAKLRQIEDMEKQQQESVRAQRLEEMKEKYSKEYVTTFVEALKKSQLPPTKPMVAEMAKYIGRAAKIGFEMSPDEAATLVREDVQLFVQRVVGDSDGETLLKILGDQIPNKIRKYDTDRLKNPEQALRAPIEQGKERPQRGGKTTRMTPQEWRMHKMGLS